MQNIFISAMFLFCFNTYIKKTFILIRDEARIETPATVTELHPGYSEGNSRETPLPIGTA